ncbi:MAG TPA: hypothetical protein QF611_00870 [Pseudomonadales bacterium]|nr:hypothetical protein [Pseudomonadales bacterium]
MMKYALFLLILICSAMSYAADDVDPNIAKQLIYLDNDQVVEFNKMLRGLNRDINKVTTKAARRNNQLPPRDIKRRMRKQVKSLYKKLDKTARGFLRDGQWDAYLAFKEAHYEDAKKSAFNQQW